MCGSHLWGISRSRTYTSIVWFLAFVHRLAILWSLNYSTNVLLSATVLMTSISMYTWNFHSLVLAPYDHFIPCLPPHLHRPSRHVNKCPTISISQPKFNFNNIDDYTVSRRLFPNVFPPPSFQILQCYHENIHRLFPLSFLLSNMRECGDCMSRNRQIRNARCCFLY